MFLKENINYCTYDMRLLYRASDDGFNWKDFHQKVDNKGPTLTLIKSEYDYVFGLYRTVNFNLTEGNYQDRNAFIFSLSKMTVHRPYNYLDYTIKNYNESMSNVFMIR